MRDPIVDPHRLPRRSSLAALLASAMVAAPLAAQAKGTAAVTGLWAAQTAPAEITVGWTRAAAADGAGGKTGGKSGGVVGYRVFRERRGERLANVAALGGSGTAFTVADRVRAGEGPRRYLVVAVLATGAVSDTARSNDVAPVSTTSGGRPEGGPASVVATVSGAHEVTLQWSAVPGATAYAIGRAVGTGGLQPLCRLCSTATTYVDRAITTGVVHRYAVSAHTVDGPSPRTQSNTVVPGGAKAVVEAVGDSTKGGELTPTGLWAAQISASEIRLVWEGAPGAAGYRLYDYQRDGRAHQFGAVGASGRTAVARVVAVGVPHRFSIHAVAPAGKALAPDTARFNVVVPEARVATADPPAAPASVSAAQTGPGEITVRWSAVPGATGYFVGRAVGTSGFQLLCALCAGGTSYVDRSAAPGQRHVYEVGAHSVQGAGRPAWSTPVVPVGAKGAVGSEKQ